MLRELTSGVYAALEIAGPSEPDVRALFHKRFDRSARRLVAAVLLRAIAADRDCIPKDIRARSVIPLFDEVLEGIYRRLEIHNERENHRKWTELVTAAPVAESQLERAVCDIKDLGDVRRFQQDLMRATKDPLAAAVIIPLLPEDLVKTRLRELISSLASCEALVGADGYERQLVARTLLADYRRTAINADSAYADRFLVAMVDRLGSILDDRVEQSGLLEASALELRPAAKRYPLHREEHEVSLRCEIHNSGRGTAFDARLSLEDSDELLIPDGVIPLGDVAPGTRVAHVDALVAKATESTTIDCYLLWADGAGKRHEDATTLTFLAQPTNVDWEALDAQLAYPQGAVQDDTRLAGRHALMSALEAGATSAELASVRISGQKRIGKSSVVRSLASRLARRDDGPITVYVDVNKLMIGDDPTDALEALMRRVSECLVAGSELFAGVQIPNYAGSLAAFNDFLEELRGRDPGRRFLVILDEFDELPNAAFERGGPGDALFRGFKAFSSDGDCGFLLVGGERLDLALAQQNDRLNGFAEHRIGFVGKDDRADFAELVEGPVRGILSYDRDAVDAIWERTGGHPFYTFQICREVVRRAKTALDSHITRREIEDAYGAALAKAAAAAFAHVWFDGIFAEGEEVTVVANKRVRALLAWAKCMRAGIEPTESNIVESAADYDLLGPETREELGTFVRRQIFAVDDERYRATSRFFGDWLRESGVERIRAGQPSLEAIRRYEAKEERDRVTPEELISLTERWGSYQATPPSDERVRAWLEQFGSARRQRLAFRLLEHLSLVSTREIKDRFEDVHKEARRDTRFDLDAQAEKGQVLRRDFAIAYIEPDGKSGVTLAQTYAQANGISKECVSSIERVDRILDKHEIQRLVIVDDLIGTGGTMCKRLEQHRETVEAAVKRTGRPALVAALAGFEEAVSRVQAKADGLGLELVVRPYDLLDGSDRCFEDHARVFESDDDRLEARQMVDQLGRDLGSPEPLGTGDCQLLVVFEHNCPNNSLPVLWKSSASLPWRALFPRSLAS